MGAAAAVPSWANQARQVKYHDRSFAYAVLFRMLVRWRGASEEKRAVKLSRAEFMHRLDQPRPGVQKKLRARVRDLRRNSDKVLADDVFRIREQMGERQGDGSRDGILPSTKPMQAVVDRRGKLVVFDGNGRLAAMRRAFPNRPDMKVEMVVHETDSPLAQRVLDRTRRARGLLKEPAGRGRQGERAKPQRKKQRRPTLRAGNRVKLLVENRRSLEARLELISSAKSQIFLQTLFFAKGRSSRKIARALAKKAEQGVDVRVLVDGRSERSAEQGLLEMMEDSGVKIGRYRAPRRGTSRFTSSWHQKSLVVDARAFITGGRNYADRYFADGPSVDIDVLVAGPTARDAHRQFVEGWRIAKGRSDGALPPRKPAPGPKRGGRGKRVALIEQKPAEKGSRATHQAYLSLIKGSKREITLMHSYLFPNRQIRRALVDAARRGVKVRILTNSKEGVNKGALWLAARHAYAELLQEGVEIYEVGDRRMHQKTATVDGETAVVGSHNLNAHSTYWEGESIALIKDRKTAERLDEHFERLRGRSQRVSPESVKSMSRADRLKGRVVANKWMQLLIPKVEHKLDGGD